MCPNMCTNMYLDTLFTLFDEFGQSMEDTLCLHNNTSKNTSPGIPNTNFKVYIYQYIAIHNYIWPSRPARGKVFT